MTRAQAAALITGLGVVAAFTAAGGWWLYATKQMPALAMVSSAPAPIAPPSATAPTATAPTAAPAPAAGEAAPPHPAPTIAAAPIGPSFDIVRVEPRGDTVVAGKGEPNAKVALMAQGKVVAEVQSDASGQFVILPPPLKPGDYDLTLRQTAPGGTATDSSQSVAVSIPGAERGSVVVALAEPGKATRVLSGVVAPAAALSPGKVVIHSAELENGTGFFASGAAAAGAAVHVYLNDAHIADVVAGKDGAWSVRVKKGLTGGHYVVRADSGEGPGHAAGARAEVPFDVPAGMAEADPSSSLAAGSGRGAAPGATASDGPQMTTGPDATIETIATAHVARGDNLWNISRYRLGDGKRYTQIYAANVEQIRDPNLIYPGQVFVVPSR